MEKNKVILVTGGYGFIGSNFLNYWVPKRPQVTFVNMDNCHHGSDPKNISLEVQFSDNYVPSNKIYNDIRRKDHVDYVFKKNKITDVINFAAETHVDRSMEHSGLFVETNVLGVENLLKAFVQFCDFKNNQNVFLQVSTDEVYGEAERPELSWKETAPVAPRNIYAATKAAGEHLVTTYGNVYGFKPRITRAGNNYGPNQDDSKLVPKMIKKAIRNEPFKVYGDGTNFRQWTHVEDHVVGLGKVLFARETQGIWNIAGNDILTNNTVISHIIEVTGSKSKIEYVPDRPGHDRGYSIDCTNIQRHLLWNQSIAFNDGIRALVQEITTKQEKKQVV